MAEVDSLVPFDGPDRENMPNQIPRIVAHRGASHDAPENTLASFRLAWQQKADGIEGDFFLTADRKIVCIHDDDTTRLSGQTLMVEQSTLDQLRALDVGQWKAPKYKGERTPTLREVLETVPSGKGMVIELKSGAEIVPVLMAELKEFNDPQLEILIITFDAATASECKTMMPEHPVHWLTGVDQETTARKIAETIKRTRADGVGMEARADLIDAELIGELNALGCKEFHVWTVDDVADAKHFQSLGAAGITTNVPAVIRQGLSG